MVLGPTNVVFNGGETVAVGQSSVAVVVNGQTFTVNPSQLVAPGTTVAVPQAPAPSPTVVTEQGVAFTVGPSQAVISGNTFAVGPGATPTTAVINGQTISVGPQGIGFASTTVPIPGAGDSGPAFSAVTAAGVSFSVNPSQAVISGITYQIGAGAPGTTAVVGGQTISLGDAGIGFAATTVAVPSNLDGPTFSAVTAGDVAIQVNPTAVVVSGQTYRIGAGAAPTTIVVGSQTISLGPGGVGLADTTITLAAVATGIRSVTAGGLTFAVNPTEAIIGGTTYRIGAGASSLTTVIGGQTVTLGPGGVGLAGTTIPPLATATGLQQVTAGGLTFAVNPTEAVISGTTYRIGAGATGTTVVVGSQTISLGPGGVGLASTTIAPPGAATATGLQSVTAGGLTFGVNPTEAVISGTTYRIGAGATPTTTVIGTQTVSFGPGGVGLASTTVPAPTRSSSSTSSPGSTATGTGSQATNTGAAGKVSGGEGRQGAVMGVMMALMAMIAL